MHWRDNQYEPTEWEDTVKDEAGNVIVQGTPVNERTLNNVETGILVAHFDIGMAVLSALQLAKENGFELEKMVNQRMLQGQETISNTDTSTYFRSSDPFVTVSLSGFSQINAPNYDVNITPISSDDMGRVGDLEVYDKTQNGFKVKMTGSASTVTFLWTLLNPRV